MLSDIEQITGYRYLCQWILDGLQDTSQDRLLDTVDKVNCQLQWPGQIWFHYHILVCPIESIPVDRNHYN